MAAYGEFPLAAVKPLLGRGFSRLGLVRGVGMFATRAVKAAQT